MMSSWIGIALLAGSWLLGLDYFYPANPYAWLAAVTAGVILLYVLYNVTYSAVSLPAGNLSDRIGQIPLVLSGYVVFAAVYAGFAAAGSWARGRMAMGNPPLA